MNGILWAYRRDYAAQHPQGGSNCVTATGNGQLNNVLRIKINGVGGKRCTGRMLNALIHRQNGKVASIGQAPAAVELLQATEHLGVAIALGKKSDLPNQGPAGAGMTWAPLLRRTAARLPPGPAIR